MLPKRLTRKTIYESGFIKLYVDKVELPSGKIVEKYHQLEYPRESVVVLLTNEQGEICFIKALRYTTQRVEWELPAGAIDEGETVLEAGERECLEETGYKTKDLQLKYSYNPANGMSSQIVHIAFGRIQTDDSAKFDTDEVKSVHWLPVSEVRAMIEKKQIQDGISLLALLLYLAKF